MKFDAVRIREGIGSYLRIQDMAQRPNFCTETFKKAYKGFYRVRQKPADWYACYFNLLAEQREKNRTLKELLEIMYENTGEVHPSFCSKLIATMNPDKPIWDKYVLQWLGFVGDGPKDPRDKIAYFAGIYSQIEKELNEHMSDKNVLQALDEFDRLIPQGRNISKMKKLDFMLWSNRSDRTVSILDYNKLLEDK